MKYVAVYIHHPTLNSVVVCCSLDEMSHIEPPNIQANELSN